MKKIISLVLCTMMILSVFGIIPATAASAQDTNAAQVSAVSDNYEYDVISESDKTVEITKYKGSEKNVNIPSVLGAYTVKSIGSRSFYYCDDIESVNIPESVTNIADHSFFGCESLSKVVIPEGVASIGYQAFYNCNKLLSVTIPNSVTTIDDLALGYYHSSEGHVKTDGFTIYGHMGFYAVKYAKTNRFAFVSLDPPTQYDYYISEDDTVEILGYNETETEVRIPSKIEDYPVISIGYQAFYNYDSLKSVIFPESVNSIDRYAFLNCTNLVSVTIPASITSIGNYAFGYYVDDGKDIKMDDFTIYGEEGTDAQRYAKDNGFTFNLIGDVDIDGQITIFDATCIQKYLAKVIDESEIDLSAADVDCNGIVNIADTTAVQKYLARSIEKL